MEQGDSDVVSKAADAKHKANEKNAKTQIGPRPTC